MKSNPTDWKVVRKTLAKLLPPPLDLPLLAEFTTNPDLSSLLLLPKTTPNEDTGKLGAVDLLSAVGLLGAWADFEQESRASWENYDLLPASILFEKAGITSTLKNELVSPMLHVLPMCPDYDCSAAAALSCFHVFALQSRGAFDVRWAKGSISELIFEPWSDQLEKRGVEIKGGNKVTRIERKSQDPEKGKGKDGYKYCISYKYGNETDAIDCDAIVFAVGAVAMGRITASSPFLQSLPSTRNFDKLRGVTCVAVRMFITPSRVITSDLKGGLHSKTQLPPDIANAMVDSPVAVCGADIGKGSIPQLKETGFCIYDLQRMHDEFAVGIDDPNEKKRDAVAVLEVDFYRADEIVNLDDEEITNIALRAVSAALGTKTIDMDMIVDKVILRARQAVSHFAPNSALYSPGVSLGENIYIAGDWIDRVGHASWSTEKSVVTAKQAAQAVAKDFNLMNVHANVIPAAEDTVQLSTLRQVARLLRSTFPVRIPPPWILAREILSGEKNI
jgi:Uncharacterized conserved protein